MRSSHTVRLVGVLLICLALGTTYSGAVPTQAISQVTLSTPLVQAEAWDYPTRTWGNPWDMNEKSDVYVFSTSCPPMDAGFTNVSASGGIWHGETTMTGAYVWFLNPGFQSTLDTLEDGQVRPIDADTYKWVSFRMYSSKNTGGIFYWGHGDLGGSFSDSGVFTVHQGWNIYVLDWSSLGAWSGDVTGFRLNPAIASGSTVEIDWIRLSEGQTGNTVSWQGTSMSGDATIAFDSGDGRGYVPMHYYVGTAEQSIPTNVTGGSFDVPISFAPGAYSAQVTVSGVSRQSSDQWTFTPVPIAQIVAPSYTSGEDFATAVVGNPWDMNGTDDVNVSWTDGDPAQAGLSYSSSAGILDITTNAWGSPCNAPWPHRPLALNQGGHNIDTSKYRYLTYRYRLDNVPDQGEGGVMRIRWLSTSKWWAGRTDDISFYDDGWTIYKLDLPNVQLEAEMSGWTSTSWDVFQLMLNESHAQWDAELDWVRLTAANEADGAYTVSWNLANVSDVLTATVYWDADQDWTNGQSSIGQVYVPPTATVPPPPAGPMFTYLPFASKSFDPDPDIVDADFSVVLSTSGLSIGSDYWVAIKLEDEKHTVWWYSELPVTIRG